MNEYTIGGTGYCLVEVTDTHNNKSGVLGLNGKEVVTDTSYDPIRHAQYFGKVVQVPSNLGGKPLTQQPIGFPAYGAIRGEREEHSVHQAIYKIGGVFKYRLMSDIAPEVKIKDMIWFKPRVLNNPENKVDEYKDDRGVKKLLYRVHYDQIICAVRYYDITMFDGACLIGTPDGPSPEEFESMWIQHRREPMPEFRNMVVDVSQRGAEEKVTAKEIIMIGSWCLLKPCIEDWGTIFKKTYYDVVDERGKKKLRPQNEWIQMKTAPEKEKMRGVVKFFGTPLRGDDCELEPNRKVWIRKVASDWILEIEGTRYIVCRQNQIMAGETVAAE